MLQEAAGRKPCSRDWGFRAGGREGTQQDVPKVQMEPALLSQGALPWPLLPPFTVPVASSLFLALPSAWLAFRPAAAFAVCAHISCCSLHCPSRLHPVSCAPSSPTPRLPTSPGHTLSLFLAGQVLLRVPCCAPNGSAQCLRRWQSGDGDPQVLGGCRAGWSTAGTAHPFGCVGQGALPDR